MPKFQFYASYFFRSSVIIGTAIGLAACQNNEMNPVRDQTFELNILHINDSHSHLDEAITQLPFFTSPDRKQRELMNVRYGGFARVTALMNQLAEHSDNTLKIHAGDAIVGDLYYRMAKGEAEAALMNTVCFDSFTLGNHEFDHGDAELKRFLDFLVQSSDCAQPTAVLSSNVKFGANSALADEAWVKPYHIIERNGEKIGLIGVTAAHKTKRSSRPDPDTEFTDEVATVQNIIHQLQRQGINKIVLQSHVGYQEDLAMVAQLKGVDVVIGGDSHSLLAPAHIRDYGLSAAGAYPAVIRDAEGKTVCVAQAWQYAAAVGQLKVNFNASGDVIDCQGRPHILLGNEFRRIDGNSEFNQNEINAIQEDIQHSQIFTLVEPDPKAVQVLEPFRVAKRLFGQKNVAWVAENLCLRRVPGRVRDVYRSALGASCNQNEFNHAHGGDVQQLVAEAFLQQGKTYFQADVALINGGGVREDLPIGDVNVDQIYRVLAFKNTLEQLTLTGVELHAMLEDAMQAVLEGHTGSYPYTAGLRWQVDLSQNKGQRITQLEINQQGNWQPLQPQDRYQLITIDFLADGQAGYDTLSKIGGERRINVGLDYTEAFLQYLDDLSEDNGHKTVYRLPMDLYSTQQFNDKIAAP